MQERNNLWQHKFKCMACGLHFILCSWYRDHHSNANITCPECGQHEGKFCHWVEEGATISIVTEDGLVPHRATQVFELVPGQAEMVEVFHVAT